MPIDIKLRVSLYHVFVSDIFSNTLMFRLWILHIVVGKARNQRFSFQFDKAWSKLCEKSGNSGTLVGNSCKLRLTGWFGFEPHCAAILDKPLNHDCLAHFADVQCIIFRVQYKSGN